MGEIRIMNIINKLFPRCPHCGSRRVEWNWAIQEKTEINQQAVFGTKLAKNATVNDIAQMHKKSNDQHKYFTVYAHYCTECGQVHETNKNVLLKIPKIFLKKRNYQIDVCDELTNTLKHCKENNVPVCGGRFMEVVDNPFAPVNINPYWYPKDKIEKREMTQEEEEDIIKELKIINTNVSKIFDKKP